MVLGGGGGGSEKHPLLSMGSTPAQMTDTPSRKVERKDLLPYSSILTVAMGSAR